ncbi:PKD domain-containing protein [Mucilaginibacter limnophilus]|uniref:PKD domain-containing protein n=1 Tax=Mucilaginibacter limnophilus TaxID=1932778 RepID=A0A3S2V823_9SPHI|nr:PKD domain-containing protein [Mucilaginibacter limnophilus]RVU00836.1 PKD domain-containing protein [Mucilaginibacter limnophilus]
MNKISTRYLLLAFFALLGTVSAFGQTTLTIQNFETGTPYARGSSIAVPFHIDDQAGNINQNNVFNLYLLDASNNVLNGGNPIGTQAGFYATFVNGTIPAGVAAGSGYKVRITSTNQQGPAVAVTSAPFDIASSLTINPQAQSNIAINSQVWGRCTGTSAQNFQITNQSTGVTNSTITVINEFNQTVSPQNATFNGTYTLAVQETNYTVIIKGVNNGIISTKAYTLINNPLKSNIGGNSNDSRCLLGSSVTVSYHIDTKDPSNPVSLVYNYPGLVYNISWGDNNSAPIPMPYNKLRAANGDISHNYTTPSCGTTSGPRRNAFPLIITASTTVCSAVSLESKNITITSPAEDRLDNPTPTGCTGEAITFVNGSYPGQDPNSTSSSCVNASARYEWYVDGVKQPGTFRLTDNFTYTFPTAKNYIVEVRLINPPSCYIAGQPHTITIKPRPQPNFNILPGNVVCSTSAVTLQNTSLNTDNQTVWDWRISPAGGYAYTGGTNNASQNPQIIFNTPGVYNVRLFASNGCTSVPSTQVRTITVNAQPIAELPADVSLCGGTGSRQIAYTSDQTSQFYVRLEGTTTADANTYFWEVTPPTGGSVNFIDPPSTKYPRIELSGTGVFTVKVTHRNNCDPSGNVTDTHTITIQDAPEVVYTPPTQIFCPGQVVPLTVDQINGTYQTFRWETPGGGTFSNTDQLTTSYTPTQAESNAGSAVVKFIVTTGLPAPCNEVIETITIQLNKPNPITSTLTQTVCSNKAFTYNITAALPNSTFEWKVDTDPSQTSSYAVINNMNGTGAIINGTIQNTNPNGAAIKVTYIITPTNAGCTGDEARLVVTVLPSNPLIDFNVTPSQGCGPVTVTITNLSPAENGTYEWDFGDGTTFTGQNPPPHEYQPSNVGKEEEHIIKLKLVSTCDNFPEVTKSVFVSPATPLPIFKATANGSCGTVTISLQNLSPGNNQTTRFLLLDANKQVIDQTTTGGPFIVQPNTDGTSKIVYVRLEVVDKCGTSASTPPDADQGFTISPSTLIQSVQILKTSPKTACTGEPLIFNNQSTGDSFTYKIYKDSDPTPYMVVNNVPKGQYNFSGFTQEGTYRITVTASTTGCLPQSESAPDQITILQSPDGVTASYQTIDCDNSKYQFNANGINVANYNYSWNFDDGSAPDLRQNPDHIFTSPGPYNVTLTVSNGVCSSNIPVQPVLVRPEVIADFSVLPGTEISIPNYHFSFRDNSQGNPVAWDWDFGNGAPHSTIQNPEYTYPLTDIGSHQVTLTVYGGRLPDGTLTCPTTKTVTVTISGTPGTLFVPNAFIPSSSNASIQTFMAKGSGIKSWHMQIFNKWGQLVWETNKLGSDGEPIEGWDGNYKGSPAPQGAYVWQVSATFINGTEWKGMSYNNSAPKRSGTINLIR